MDEKCAKTGGKYYRRSEQESIYIACNTPGRIHVSGEIEEGPWKVERK